ncbi:hypothetical protein EJV46_01365 [Roseococcus sp. SYP-B2431]|uniref:hypothetical protein n=1 Tax=Roseococcus sp. SYP-B2431 TaxID=2496640 RepID=UPI001040185E|nr:hypothetical protein [Roseococcus sp. SYP-B2431]TCI00687.1 hypothetical protein EJV46_01365 [Roseococcus sp. SYP-B2431]
MRYAEVGARSNFSLLDGASHGAPFGSVEEVARRSGVGRPTLEALAAADAFDSTATSGGRSIPAS